MMYIDVIVAIASILGALLASSRHHKERGAGYLIWIFSNGAIALMFWWQNNIPMVLTFVAYEILNVRGLYNNWIRK